MIVFTIIFAALIGVFVGRFMALTVYFLPQILLEGCDKGRVPNDIFNYFFQKPFCWRCKHTFEGLLKFPVLNYFLAKGKCPHCQQPLGLKVIVLEFGIALLFAACTLWIPLGPTLISLLFMSCLLICCFITDFEYGILPDQFTLTLIWVGLIGSLNPIFITSQEAIVGAVGGYGIFWGFNFIYRSIRKFDGMYPGDFKLNAGIGACVGIKLLIPILVISMVLLVIGTLIQFFICQKKTAEGYLYTEVPYACYTSIVTVTALYLYSNT